MNKHSKNITPKNLTTIKNSHIPLAAEKYVLVQAAHLR